MLPLQHPPAQLDPLQTQFPFEHTWPAPQGPPVVPHTQVPPVQRSEVDRLQLAHAEPPEPHDVVEVAVTQVLPWQHPPGQLVPLQTHAPLTQVWPAPHGLPEPHRHACEVQRSVEPLHTAHEAPPVPHRFACVPDWHTPPLQHPPGQLVLSHTHTPLRHRWPAAHGAPVPQ